MASPPSSVTSPPAMSPLALPGGPPRRPTLALPTGSIQSRKPSTASATSSTHPLRQTSFPPPDSLDAQHALATYSPVDDEGDLDVSDADIMSAISGPVADLGDGGSRKRKRGEKRARGRPPKNSSQRGGTASLVNGDDARSTRRGAPTVLTADGGEATADGDDDDEPEPEDDQEGLLPGQGQLSQADFDQAKRRKAIFRLSAKEEHAERYNTYDRVKLRTADLRRIVNQTLSQSVPPNVVNVVSAYAKLFAGVIIEAAREVQDEWTASSPQRPDGEDSAVYERLAKKRKRDGRGSSTKKTKSEGAEGAENGKDGADAMQTDEPAVKRSRSNSVAVKAEDMSMSPPAPQENGANGGQREHTSGSNDSGGANGASVNPPRPNSTLEDRSNMSADQAGQPRLVNNGPDSSCTLEASSPHPAEEADGAQESDHDGGGALGLKSSMSQLDRGPLLPDHLREALRRYKKRRSGGPVGFTGLSLEGREVAAPRMGGKKLFR